ncbi:synapse-associated protein 1-like [Oppia nitens]|uniref:synapse-associated protein 1-like n=1 Tax=Oppia nitens TaxID=1686743 RepID=UPI0023D9BAB4|nr:synapse-associated protein 1-like [Oppia nitens]
MSTDQVLENDIKSDRKLVRRSSSGDTSGPDDDDYQNQMIDATEEDNTDATNKVEDKQPMTTEVSQKVMESTKYFGNLIFSAASKARQTMTATAKQIKQTVEHAGIMQDFTKEQQQFIKDHGGHMEVGVTPWVGCHDPDAVKQEILSLSQDKRNFVRSPPTGVQFNFDLDSSYPIALALLKEDPNLNKMRFEIVPKLVKEDVFWRNYFYRVSLIKQSTQLSSFDKKGRKSWSSSRSSSAEGPDEPGDDQSPTGAEPEFISDAYQGTQVSADDIHKDIKQNKNKVTDDLEEELSRDLQEFEVVAGDAVNIDEEELERELAEMDLK